MKPRLLLLATVLTFSLAAMLAGRTAAAQEPGLVDCLDETRGVLLRVLAWRCDGRVLTPEEAQRWRDRLAAERRERLREAGRTTDRPEERPTTIGTGFRVDPGGRILTNRHVVEGCRRLRLSQDGRPLGTAQLLAAHPTLDVALLDSNVSGPAARFAPGPAPEAGAGDAAPLLVVGYPRQGVPRVQAEATRVSVAPERARGAYFLVRGEFRPGNSGSPLLDAQGRVVGMATARQDRVATFAETGTLPPATGVAIAAPALVDFLAGQGVVAGRAGSAPDGMPDGTPGGSLAAQSRGFVLRIDCWR